MDAELLANILRNDRNAHRPLPADSELVQAIGVVARAQQDAVGNPQHVANQLRSLLREYYPAFLEPFRIDGHMSCRIQMPSLFWRSLRRLSSCQCSRRLTTTFLRCLGSTPTGTDTRTGCASAHPCGLVAGRVEGERMAQQPVGGHAAKDAAYC
jgi:hypothetical protein